MTAEIKTWEILDDRLVPLETTLAEHGRTETFDLESWLESDPSIIRPGLKVIGRQVTTRSGTLDLLAIDISGSLVIIELKRDKLPRQALAQAIDYASDVATWSVDKIGEVCAKHTGQSLEEALADAFPDVDLENLNINEAPRIVLVGFAVEAALERMIEWLSGAYGVAINVVVLKYVRTQSGNELLTRTALISEQIEDTRVKKRKITYPMSDEAGSYEADELRALLVDYLSKDLLTARGIRSVLLPACLASAHISREELKVKFVESGLVDDQSKVGRVLSILSQQMGREKHDFLRQVIGYKYPDFPWQKDNYFIRDECRDLVAEVLRDTATDQTSSAD